MTTIENLEKMIYIKNKSISNELAINIIDLFENENQRYKGVIESGLNTNIKTTTDYIIDNTDEKWKKIENFLQRELIRNLKKYREFLNTNNKNYNTNQYTTNSFKFLNENIFTVKNYMIQKYDKGIGRYVYHNDFSCEHNSEQKIIYRVITFIWYLNDVNEGGETEFWGQYKIKPERGKLIFFPASWTFPHCGKMPISDNKYIITGWIYEKN
jgi:hypothetical protein